MWKIISQPAANQLLECTRRPKSTLYVYVTWQKHQSNMTETDRPPTKMYVQREQLNFVKVDKSVNRHINYRVSVKYQCNLLATHSLEAGICRDCGRTHTHTWAQREFYVYNKPRKWLSGELPAVSGDKGRLRRPRGHFPLSGAASLLTWSQSQGVMEVEKVINPALQRGQDSSIKPLHKDSHIFNYCFQSAEQS